jgi:hypothetical protein
MPPHYFTHQGIGGNPPAGTVAYPGFTQDSPWVSERYWDNSVLVERMQPAVDFGNTHNVRMMAGEYGASNRAPDEDRKRWFQDVLDLFEQNGFDYMYFQYEATEVSGDGAWTFENTSFESLITSMLSLNLVNETGMPAIIYLLLNKPE